MGREKNKREGKCFPSPKRSTDNKNEKWSRGQWEVREERKEFWKEEKENKKREF